MQEREGLFYAQEEGEIINLLADTEVGHEKVQQDEKHPRGQNEIRCGLVLLAYKEEFDENGNPNSRHDERFHGWNVLNGEARIKRFRF